MRPGRARSMFSMAENADGREVFVALPEEKRAVASLEKKGLVTVRRTDEKCGGFQVWYYAKK